MNRLGFVVLGLALALPLMSPGEAKAIAPKWIILISREFTPVGQMNPAGTQVNLTHIIQVSDGGMMGLGIRYTIMVVQPQTGAKAVGIDYVTSNVRPFIPVSSVHLVPGSPSFQPGPAVVSAQATLFFKNQFVRTWNWTQTIMIAAP